MLVSQSLLTFMLVQRNVPGGARKRQTLGSIKFGLDPLPIRTPPDYVNWLAKSNSRSMNYCIRVRLRTPLPDWSRTGEGAH